METTADDTFSGNSNIKMRSNAAAAKEAAAAADKAVVVLVGDAPPPVYYSGPLSHNVSATSMPPILWLQLQQIRIRIPLLLSIVSIVVV